MIPTTRETTMEKTLAPQDRVTFKNSKRTGVNGEIGVFTVDGLVLMVPGKLYAAISQNGKGAGCFRVTLFKRVKS